MLLLKRFLTFSLNNFSVPLFYHLLQKALPILLNDGTNHKSKLCQYLTVLSVWDIETHYIYDNEGLLYPSPYNIQQIFVGSSLDLQLQVSRSTLTTQVSHHTLFFHLDASVV